MYLDIEKELESAIRIVGGRRVSSIVGNAPGFENADFIFDSAGVMAELKCLDEDKIGDERIIEKASQLYLEELMAQKAPVIVYGTAHLTTKGFSREYWEKIGSLYRIPIERTVRKADRQIQATKNAMIRPSDKGLLILANNNHSALSPWHAKYVLEEILQQPLYKHLNSAVFFTANQRITAPGSEQDFDCWIEIRRSGVEPVPQEFLDKLRSAWYKHLANLRGMPEPTQVQIDANTLARLDNQTGGLTSRLTRTPPALPTALSQFLASSASFSISVQAGPVRFIR